MTYASISHVIGITRATFLKLQDALGLDKNEQINFMVKANIYCINETSLEMTEDIS